MKYLIAITLISSLLLADMLTLEESITKALNNYPNIKIFQLKVQQSKSDLDNAKSDNLPQVNLQANYNISQTYVFPANGQFNTLNDNGWNAGLFFKQKIWDFSKTTYKIEAFKIEEDISKLSLEEQKTLLVYQVKSLYNLLIVQKEAIEVREKDIEVKEAYYQQALAFVKHGLKTNADASRFLSSIYIAKENLAQSQSAYEKTKNALSLYIGEKIDNNIQLENRLLDVTTTIPSEDEILDTNYQVKISNRNISKNITLHKSAKASYYGSIDAIASYNHIDTLNSYNSKFVGVSLTVPLYNGGKISSEVQKSAIGVQIANEQKEATILALKKEILDSYSDIKEYRTTIEAKEVELQSSQETTKLLEGRYKNGLTTYIEVLDAISLERDIKLGLLNTKYKLNNAIYKLQYLQGKSL